MVGTREEEAARRKRAAVELIAREGAALRRTAMRYSLCAEDAEDAYQRALEILLRKAPGGKPRDLIRWTQTVVKHEALAVRSQRERLLGPAPPPGVPEALDRVGRIASPGDGPQEQTERRERVARSREALQALKPAELRALTLLAAGYSYAEIGAVTGFSRTKINRCLAEGRERFRSVLAGSEDGSRCAELGPLLSAHCDGETSAAEAALVREHLRACAACRATMRAYRTVPATVAALAPGAAVAMAGAEPASRSLLGRLSDLVLSLQSRLPGGTAADSSAAQVAATGGARGAGAAALAKALAICAGTVGGAAACVAGGVVPAPLGLAPAHDRAAKIERVSHRVLEQASPPEAEYAPAPAPAPAAKPEPKPVGEQPAEAPSEASAPSGEASAGAVEYAPPPPPPPPAEAAPSSASSGSPAGEFGP